MKMTLTTPAILIQQRNYEKKKIHRSISNKFTLCVHVKKQTWPPRRQTQSRGERRFKGNRSKHGGCHHSKAITLRNQHLLLNDTLKQKKKGEKKLCIASLNFKILISVGLCINHFKMRFLFLFPCLILSFM